MNPPTPLQRLADLFKAADLAPLSGQDHRVLVVHAQELEKFIVEAGVKAAAEKAPKPE